MLRLIVISLLVGINGILPVPSYAQEIDLTVANQIKDRPRLQKGKRADNLKAHDKFSFETIARNLGSISILVHDEDTKYLTADKESGRIWQLIDRNKDGRIETKRALAHRFDKPTGLAIDGNRVFVADQNAVWVFDDLQPPQILAGLRQSNSNGKRHILSLSSDKTTLFLGLTTKDQTVKILSIDINTGQATLVSEASTFQNLIAFGHPNQTSPWVVLENSFGANLSNLIEIDPSHSLNGVAIPRYKDGKNSVFNNHIYLSRHASEGFDILATPMNLDQVNGLTKVVLSGFLSPTKRSAWGSPAALLFDNHGLIIADEFNGDLYRLRAKDIEQKISENENTDIQADDIQEPQKDVTSGMRVSTMRGSLIGPASRIGKGSSITKGSNLSEDYKSLAEEVKESEEKKQDEKALN